MYLEEEGGGGGRGENVFRNRHEATLSPTRDLSPPLLCEGRSAVTHMTQPKAQMSDSQPWPCLLRTSGER